MIGAEDHRLRTGLAEFDFVLGGGIVPGSMVLVGGEPGIGKSTILLQVAAQLQAAGVRTLYVSGEESPLQVKLRADRLGGSSGAVHHRGAVGADGAGGSATAEPADRRFHPDRLHRRSRGSAGERGAGP